MSPLAKRRPGTPFNRPDVDPLEALCECMPDDLADRVRTKTPTTTRAIMKLRAKLRDLRSQTDRPHEVLCGQLKIHRVTLYRLLGGDVKPTLEVARHAAEHCGIHDVLDWYEPPA